MAFCLCRRWRWNWKRCQNWFLSTYWLWCKDWRQYAHEGLVYIPPLSRIGENVFIGPGAVLTNDPYPPSEKLAGVIIEDNAVIGSKAVIKAGVTIGKNSVVAMGAVVTNDVPPDTVVVGIPAKPKYSRDEYDKKQSEWKSI